MPGIRQIGCVILAAGSARRFGSNKLAATLDGRSLIRRTLEAIPEDVFDRVTVVTRYPEIMHLAGSFHFAALWNPHPEAGLSLSVRMGLTSLRDCAAVAFTVADQPLLRRESLQALVMLSIHHPDRITALGHGGVRGNPCIFPARFFPELMALTGDRGGSAVIRAHPEALLLQEADARELTDVDTPAALAALSAGSSANHG